MQLVFAADFNVLPRHHHIQSKASVAGASAVHLPDAASVPHRRFIVEDIAGNAGTNAITVTPMGSQTIDGSTSASVAADFGRAVFRSDGRNWVQE